MSDNDWIKSPRSSRVWLLDSMKALGQFAFIAPIHRVKHWNPTTKKRNKCWAKESECVFCKNGTPKINEFTYGIYINEMKEVKPLPFRWIDLSCKSLIRSICSTRSCGFSPKPKTFVAEVVSCKS